ncbi:hypothetical protein J6590_041439 [Homalodisca vitripennis]|nr:hypothetical protein J6590_041439 [Homalodisca vitripennis]
MHSNVYYYEDGHYINTSIDKPECVHSTSTAWKLWKLPKGLHKESIFEDYDYKQEPGRFQKNYKPFELEIGKYKLLFETKHVQRRVETVNYIYCYFNVLSLPLVALIDEGSERKIYKQHGLTLSAKRSYDPNMPPSEQGHVYLIMKCKSSTSPEKTEEMCKPRKMECQWAKMTGRISLKVDRFSVLVSEELYIPPHKLRYSANYRFTVEVRTELYDDCEECSKPLSPAYAYADIQVLSEKDEMPYEVFIASTFSLAVYAEQLNSLQISSAASNVTISGLPVSPQESVELVKHIGTALGMEMNKKDIPTAPRVPTFRKDSHPPLIVLEKVANIVFWNLLLLRFEPVRNLQMRNLQRTQALCVSAGLDYLH